MSEKFPFLEHDQRSERDIRWYGPIVDAIESDFEMEHATHGSFVDIHFSFLRSLTKSYA